MSAENLFIKIEGKTFRCTDKNRAGHICGANVFHLNENGKYVCNGCGATYIGTPKSNDQ